MLTIIQNDPKVTLSAYADYLAEMGGAYRTFHPYAGEALNSQSLTQKTVGASGENVKSAPQLYVLDGYIPVT